MKKTYTKKQITEAIAYWEKQLDEARHDGTWLPKHPTRRNVADKPTVYYIAVDEVFNLSNYGGYVMPNGSLTDSTSNVAFNHAAKTRLPSKLKEMVSQAVKKYGKDKYVLVYKEEYSHGNQTGKDHARSGLMLDAWVPKNGGYWYYGYQPIDRLVDTAVVTESREFDSVKSIKISCATDVDLNGQYFRASIQDEMKELGIAAALPLDWLSYVFGHMFSSNAGWTEEIENMVLDPKVKRIDVIVGDDLVSIEKNA